MSYAGCEQGWREALADPAGHTNAFVAEGPDGQVAGLASGGPLQEPLPPYDGELYVLYVLPAFQGRGYGKALLNCVARDLLSRGFTAMLVWVLQENRPGCAFYRRLGGRPVGEKTVAIGGVDLVDVAYGWPDLAARPPSR